MDEEWVVIEHADGRRYSVTREAHGRLYADFTILGEETPESFAVTGIPEPRVKHARARRKNAAPITEPE